MCNKPDVAFIEGGVRAVQTEDAGSVAYYYVLLVVAKDVYRQSRGQWLGFRHGP